MGKADAFVRALESNHAWASKITELRANHFPESAKSQSPSILWIGCGDSRIPETTILGLEPGNVFVHRNIANILVDNDLSSLSAIEFAVRHLRVDHAVVCGHTSCGGVMATLGNVSLGIMDPWLQPLRRLRLQFADELARLPAIEDKTRRLAELNVLQSLSTLKSNATVIEAVKMRGFKLHGVMYDLATGKLSEVTDSEAPGVADARTQCFDLPRA